MMKKIRKFFITLVKLPYLGLKRTLRGVFISLKYSLMTPIKFIKWFLKTIFTLPVKIMDEGFEYCSRHVQKYLDRFLEYLGKILIFIVKAIWQLLLPIRNPNRWLKENYVHIMNQILEDQNFANRFFSSIIMAAIAIPVIIVGGWLLQILMIIVITISAWEWGGLAPGGAYRQKRIIFTVFMAITLILMRPLGPAAPALISIFLFIDVFIPKPSVERSFHNQLGFSYLFVAALSFSWIHDNFGALATLWLVLSVIATDVAAFMGGRAFGGAKLAPSISPNKTISGSFCAICAAGFIGFLYSGISGKPIVFFILLSMLTSIMAQIGDLLESMLKRRVGVKDSGSIVPGHGGVLDRIDGFLMATPTAFLVLKITEWVN